jgi:hypothetical protein
MSTTTTQQQVRRDVAQEGRREAEPVDGTASGAVPTVFEGDTQVTFTITSPELDFGGREFADGSPTTSAYLGWNPNEVTRELAPFVSGYLHFFNAAGVRAAIQLKQYDKWDNVISSRIERVPVVETQDQQMSAAQWMFADYPSADIYRVNVSIVMDVSQPEDYPEAKWSWVAGRNFYVFEMGLPVEQVTLSGIEHHFGGSAYDENGAPTGPGFLTWVTDNETVSPVVSGTLHAQNARTTEISLRITTYDMFNHQLGQEVLADSLDVQADGHVSRPVVWTPDVADPRIHHAFLALVIKNGNVWERLDRVRLYL